MWLKFARRFCSRDLKLTRSKAANSYNECLLDSSPSPQPIDFLPNVNFCQTMREHTWKKNAPRPKRKLQDLETKLYNGGGAPALLAIATGSVWTA